MRITNEEQHRKMLNAPIGRLLFEKSYPTVIIQLITVIYNAADTYFVAKIDTAASAAVGIVFSLMAVIQAFGFGIGMGANSLISRSLGAEKKKKQMFTEALLFLPEQYSELQLCRRDCCL